MSELVAILAAVFFFVAFGIAQKLGGRGPSGCEHCDADSAAECAECSAATERPKSNDASA